VTVLFSILGIQWPVADWPCWWMVDMSVLYVTMTLYSDINVIIDIVWNDGNYCSDVGIVDEVTVIIVMTWPMEIIVMMTVMLAEYVEKMTLILKWNDDEMILFIIMCVWSWYVCEIMMLWWIIIIGIDLVLKNPNKYM